MQVKNLPDASARFGQSEINLIRSAVSSKMDLDRDIGDEEVRDLT